MGIAKWAALVAVSALVSCAHSGMQHGDMSHDEMMRHCQMMTEHSGEAGHNPHHHDPAQHGGMSHEEMQRQCAAMRGESQEAPHQH